MNSLQGGIGHKRPDNLSEYSYIIIRGGLEIKFTGGNKI